MISRRLAVTIASIALAALLAAAALAQDPKPRRVVGHGLVRYNGLGPERWARRYRLEHRRFLAEQAHLHRLRRQLRKVRTLQVHHAYWATTAAGSGADPRAVIRSVFGAYGEQAVRVADCETGGTFSTSAQNGQYLGLFQMGDYARSRYGHGADPWTQARAAYRYFVDAGSDWSPWECKP